MPKKVKADVSRQPFEYPFKREFKEPEWTRLPGYKGITKQQWESALWQRQHSAKNVKDLKDVFGPHLSDALAEEIVKDQLEMATMSLLIPPHMLNCMDEKDLKNDPVRRYMIAIVSDRHPQWPNHPKASRDSLHESEMWVREGLTHRYPTKVLAEMIATCPQYCGHCTRMDLVGNSVPQVTKRKFSLPPKERYEAMLDYLRRTPSVRDVVVSGGDIANVPIVQLESFVMSLLDIPNIRDIRLATKGLQGLPQHFLQDDVLGAFDRIAKRSLERGVDIAVHTHVNHANQVTPLVGRVVRKILDMGFRDVRNQGVLLRGVNATQKDLLELCFMLLDHAKIMPYYFYMADMIPNSEHWRLSVAEGMQLQHDIMGYLPGFATPRVTVDVPYVGKRWIHQLAEYDRVKGISYWTKGYRTGIESDDEGALTRRYEYLDPVYTLPPEGQSYWRKFQQSAISV
ncbi:MAG: lysine 2,3-aminomutase [Elusimicrobiota bacterium]